MAKQFSEIHGDLSTANGYQFEFRCQKCGRSRKSALIPNRGPSQGTGGGRFLTRIFGGGAAHKADEKSVAWDEALHVAAHECRPHFQQCPDCQEWACRESCWSEKTGRCPSCEPQVRATPAPQPQSQPQAQPKPHQAQPEVQKPAVAAKALPPLNRTTCPFCGGRVDRAKTCAKCGNPLEVAKKCHRCPHVVPAGAKFCLKCGTAQ